jgi:hypothetical protein
MKSGTTFLQSLMTENRPVLAERDVFLPGTRWRDQVDAVADVLGRERVAAPPRPGAWDALVEEVCTRAGTGVVSMEFLGPVGLQKIARVVESFGTVPVEVVVTARDLNRNIPAMWQETLKNGRSFTFAEYVAAVQANDGPGRSFWREQTVAAMCRRWSEVVGVEQVTLVTVPRPGAPRTELWDRFCTALRVDGEGVNVPGAVNESLGAASTEVMRLLNARLDDLDFPAYAPVVKHRFAKAVLAPRRELEAPVGFDTPEWLPPLADRMIGRIRELGVRVVGDLEDLRPVSVPGVDPSQVPDGERLEAAVAGLEGLLRRMLRELHPPD